MRRLARPLSILAIALALRLYPTLSSGLPFSTDAWSPIRNAELLVEYTPVSLSSGLFDGYNSYWPANSLYGVIFSYATGLRLPYAMAVGVPLAGALAVLIFYVLMIALSKGHEAAYYASIILAAIYPYTLLMAGVTKETYANPLYLAAILLFIGRVGWREALLFSVVSVALVMAHHLTTFVAIAVLVGIALAQWMRGSRGGPSDKGKRILLISLLVTITALYLGLFAYRGLNVSVTASDWISLGSYELAALAMAAYFAFRPPLTPAQAALACTTAAASVSAFALLITRTSVIPGAPVLPGSYLLYMLPFIVASPLAVLGLVELGKAGGERYAVPLFWLATILGLGGYAVFGGPPVGHILAYRSINFLCVPLAIACANGLQGLSSSPQRRRELGKLVAMASLATIVALGSFGLYAAVSLQERYLGYFWLYRPADYAAATLLAARSNQTIATDVKFAYLLNGYFDLKVDVYQALKYLAGGGGRPRLLLVYDQMAQNGFVFYGGYSIGLPDGWTKKLRGLNLVYSNGDAGAYSW